MDIMAQIKLCAAEYEMSTGLKPTRVYLGRTEIAAVIEWAVSNNLAVADMAIEGASRPELHGLKTYAVNDDDPHIRCCV